MHGRQARVQSVAERGQRGGREGQVQLKKVREREGETVRERDGARGGADGAQDVSLFG